MGKNRLFWPQEMLDEWVVEEKISIEDDLLTVLGDNMKYRLKQAVHFVADVGDGSDPHDVIGRVKEVEALEEMGAEHYHDSVLLEDSAYQVVPGFTGEPVIETLEALAGGDAKAVKGPEADGAEKDTEDRELLARFLLDNL